MIVHDPYLPPWIAQEYRVELVADLEKLAARSDFVSLHVPLNDRTREMVGKSFLQTMKPTAFLINTGRGQTLDEAALATALKEGWIAGAGLDVFHQEPLPVDSPLLDLDNVILTPHTAGLSEQVLGRGFQILGQGGRPHPQGSLSHVAGESRGTLQAGSPPSGRRCLSRIPSRSVCVAAEPELA